MKNRYSVELEKPNELIGKKLWFGDSEDIPESDMVAMAFDLESAGESKDGNSLFVSIVVQA